MRNLARSSAVLGAFLLVACDGGGGSSCPTGGATAMVVVTNHGLPAGVAGVVTLHGTSTAVATGDMSFTDFPAGPFTVTTELATTADPRVRTVYEGKVSTSASCARSGATTTVDVTWTEVPTSHRLFATNGNGSTALIAFGADALATAGSKTGAPYAVPVGGDVTFDRVGNLYALGATLAEATIVRANASRFAPGATTGVDVSLDVEGVSCIPRANGIAFGPDGDLWVSIACAQRIVRLPKARLDASGAVTPSVTLTGLTDPQGLAFDASGALYAADDGDVVRFDANVLATSATMPSARFSVSDMLGAVAGDVVASRLAFAASGDLWILDFGGNAFYRVPSASLAASGTSDVSVAVRVTLPVSALLYGMAFDEGGGLSTAYSNGKLARLSPAQLTVTTGGGAPTIPELVYDDAQIGNLDGVAIYPAPAALPLYHALP